MTYPLIRYPLDPTGLNANNLVVGEEHDLSALSNTVLFRAAATFYGPFFAESLVVWDAANNVQLTRGTTNSDGDYRVMTLLQDASATFGKEICQAIIVTNQAVSARIRINYQVLGGNYQNNAQAIAEIFETYLRDDRPVDWVTQVFGKPLQYPPSLHMHMLEDIIGFGPLVVAIERLGQSITLSNIPAFEALIDWVQAYVKDVADENEISEALAIDKTVSLKGLLYAARKLNFNAITFRPSAREISIGGWILLTVDCTHFDQGENLFWTIKHEGTSPGMFAATDGFVSVVNQQASFSVNTAGGSENYGRKRFTVELRRNRPDGPVIATCGDVIIDNPDPNAAAGWGRLKSGLYMEACCLYNPLVVIDAEALYLVTPFSDD